MTEKVEILPDLICTEGKLYENGRITSNFLMSIKTLECSMFRNKSAVNFLNADLLRIF